MFAATYPRMMPRTRGGVPPVTEYLSPAWVTDYVLRVADVKPGVEIDVTAGDRTRRWFVADVYRHQGTGVVQVSAYETHDDGLASVVALADARRLSPPRTLVLDPRERWTLHRSRPNWWDRLIAWRLRRMHGLRAAVTVLTGH